MSLMLRKKCEEVLNNTYLENFHADIHQDTKVLQLVSECGKPLVSVNGITFSRNAPTNAEIEYCSELLTIFINKHRADIEKVLTLQKQIKNFPDLRKQYPEYTFITKNSYVKNPSSITYTDTIYFIRVYIKGDIEIEIDKQVARKSRNIIKDVLDGDIDKGLAQKVRIVALQWMKQYKTQLELNAAITHLSTCEI